MRSCFYIFFLLSKKNNKDFVTVNDFPSDLTIVCRRWHPYPMTSFPNFSREPPKLLNLPISLCWKKEIDEDEESYKRKNKHEKRRRRRIKRDFGREFSRSRRKNRDDEEEDSIDLQEVSKKQRKEWKKGKQAAPRVDDLPLVRGWRRGLLRLWWSMAMPPHASMVLIKPFSFSIVPDRTLRWLRLDSLHNGGFKF